MTPWQKAKAWQDEHDATTDFWTLLGEHLSSGLVWNSSKTFMLASEARWNAEEQAFESGEPNCWFVRLAASAGHANAVREFLRVAPKPQQYAAWCRRGSFEPRVYDWNKLIKKTGGQ
jgi:hypothetical protein